MSLELSNAANLATFQNAVGLTPLVSPANNKVGLIGHSMLDQAIPNYAGSYIRQIGLALAAWPAFVGMLSRGRYVFPDSCKFAVSGCTSNDVVNTVLTSTTAPFGYGVGLTQLQAACASPARIVMVWAGHNDIFATTPTISPAQTAANHVTIARALIAAGKVPVFLTTIPTGNSTFSAQRLTGNNLLAHIENRNWLVNTLPYLSGLLGKCFTIDLWSAYADLGTSATPGDALASVLADGTHSSNYGSYKLAAIITNALNALGLGLPQSRIHAPGETYDPTYGLNGNLMPSSAAQGALYGTGTSWTSTQGGVTFSGTRALAANAVSADGNVQAGTFSVTGSMVTTATGNWWQIAISGTSGSGGGALTIGLAAPTLTNLNAGDKLAAFGEFEIDSGATGIYAFPLGIRRTFASGNPDYCGLYERVSDQTVASSIRRLDTLLASTGLAGTYNGDIPNTVSGTETAITWGPMIRFAESASVSINYRIRNFALRKVQ